MKPFLPVQMGQSRIFERKCVTSFFHDSNPSRLLMNRLKYFWIQIQCRKDIWIFKNLYGVEPTAKSDSAVCIIPWSLTLRCASHHGVMKTKYLKKTLRSASHPCHESDSAVKFRSVHHTTESVTCQMCVLIQNFTINISLWCLKKNTMNIIL